MSQVEQHAGVVELFGARAPAWRRGEHVAPAADDAAGSEPATPTADQTALRLMEQVAGEGAPPAPVLVGPGAALPAMRRIARFVTAGTGRVGVDVVAVDGSPFRAAAVVRAATRLDLVGEPRDVLLPCLHVLARRTRSLVVAPSARRLGRPRPAFRQRLARLAADEVFVGEEGTGLWRVSVASDLPPDLLAGIEPQDTLALVAGPASEGQLPSLLPRLTSRSADSVATHPDWTAWWGDPQACEIVLAPASRDAVVAAGRELVDGAWRCYWCQGLQFRTGPCPRCRADDRPPASLLRAPRREPRVGS